MCSAAAWTAPPVPFGRRLHGDHGALGQDGLERLVGRVDHDDLLRPGLERGVHGPQRPSAGRSRSCRTFGVLDFMRVPWPAAMTMTTGAWLTARMVVGHNGMDPWGVV